MPGLREFRFATGSFETTRAAMLAEARKAEGLGYDVFIAADHPGFLAPIPLLMLAAENVGMRLGTYVLCNDFRHPVVLVQEAATLDVLSGGRLELGLGAGYMLLEYQMAGIQFDTGGVRFQRLTETVQIAELAFAGETFSFSGSHYQIRDCTPCARPVQRPRPPLVLGGGGRRLLTFAAERADIISILPAAAPGGGLRASQLPLKSLKDKAALVAEAAGARAADLEINILIYDVVITRDRRAAARAYLDDLQERLGPVFTVDGEVTVDDLLDSPYLAFGTGAQIVEHLLRVREETGASYLSVFPYHMDALAPVLSRLANPQPFG
jgi:probable F420-dependent oxidoreductase